jgi:nicotinamide-nucleotide amidase
MSEPQRESGLFAGLLAELESRNFKLAIAESLTGGLLSSSFVSVEGASRVFLGSVVAYQNSVKQSLLDVPQDVLDSKGAVSAEVAIAMASGVRELFARQTDVAAKNIVALSTTGMASPALADTNGQSQPHGLVFVAVLFADQPVRCLELNLSGSRNEIRQQSAETAATLLQALIQAD